tara:strand:- start:1611 stop:1883 length:273 start_codon:yes stop_codon:yes gene_type:complete
MKDKEYKELEILEEDMPHDLKVAIEAVVTQTSIMEEYDLDEMPLEYVQNLIDISLKYPEYNELVDNLVDAMGFNIEFVDEGPLDAKDLPN